jgi:hypothetical protein
MEGECFLDERKKEEKEREREKKFLSSILKAGMTAKNPSFCCPNHESVNRNNANSHLQQDILKEKQHNISY